MKIFFLLVVINVFGVEIRKRIKESPSFVDTRAKLMESAFVVETNQGSFASKNTNFTRHSTIMQKTTVASMLRRLDDAQATLKRAWVRWSFPHFSLLTEFTDARCEEMEWVPINNRSDVPGEHPAGEAILHYDVQSSRCGNAKSLIGLPDPMIGYLKWFEDAIKLKYTQEEVDVVRWIPDHLEEVNQHVTRRQLYSAFLEEANRFKDEKKYSCSSFINNAFGIATGHRFVDQKTMVYLLQVGTQRFGYKTEGKLYSDIRKKPSALEFKRLRENYIRIFGKDNHK